ncbi:DUF2759 domain-containing protein [Brevibacillus sp. TJ4]|uniref:DUF2759 domain-containing protein n=1 Tax=Brevibacillus sp. TJ4 TaxID=3234853 RepID=UPI0037D5E9D5
MKFIFFDFLMFVFTVLIAWGFLRSVKAKNKFASAFAFVSLVTFLFCDGLILYYATS